MVAPAENAPPSADELLSPRVSWKTWDRVMADRVTQLEQNLILKQEGMLRPEDLFIPTDLVKWDSNGGVTRGVLTVIGGVDGQGKSFVKKHLAMAAARRGLKVAMLDFEDPESKTADRELSTLTGINSKRLAMMDIDGSDLGRVMTAARKSAGYGARIKYHTGLVDATEAMRALTELAADPDTKPDLVLLDYMQALPEGENKSLERTIAQLAWESNVFAQRVGCGFVVFSQVVRDVASRGQAAFWAARKRDPEAWDVSGFCPGPGTQDLAWSSAFGQRARCVAYLFRPGYYEKSMGKPGAADNRLFLRFSKVTFGDSGVIELGFNGAEGRIYDL